MVMGKYHNTFQPKIIFRCTYNPFMFCVLAMYISIAVHILIPLLATMRMCVGAGAAAVGASSGPDAERETIKEKYGSCSLTNNDMKHHHNTS